MMKKLWKITSNTIGGLLFILICFFLFISASSRLSGQEPAILGHQMKTVLSGSMEPTFQTGSIIFIKLSSDSATYQKGDIITFRVDDRVITHRIFDVKKHNGQVVYKTKGDHNNGPDLWTISGQAIIGEYTGFTIPYLGFALNYFNTKIGTALLLILPGLYLIISAFREAEPKVNEVKEV